MSEATLPDWKRASQTFDTVAAVYDRYRPAYPPELVDCIIRESRIPSNGRILEVGSGTGKATRLFTCRGYAITCIEPGGHMAAVAARQLQDFRTVTFEICRFEDWQETPEQFDLVISAQAFHWVPPEVGYAKAARALKPGGSLALFWNRSPGLCEPVAAQLQSIYQEFAPGLGSPQQFSEASIQEDHDRITQSGCFGPVSVWHFPWTQTYHTEEYLGLLNTYSDHLLLPGDARKRLFDAVGAAIDKDGGLLRKDYVTVLYLAQRTSLTRRTPCADVSH